MCYRFHCFALLAVLTTCSGLAAEQVEAAWLGFRNDTTAVLVVQRATIINTVIRREKPRVLYPGEVMWDTIDNTGDKLLFIYPAKQPSLILFQDKIPNLTQDSFFSIQAIPPQPAMPRTPPQPPRAVLIPARPPTPPPGGGSAAANPPGKGANPGEPGAGNANPPATGKDGSAPPSPTPRPPGQAPSIPPGKNP